MLAPVSIKTVIQKFRKIYIIEESFTMEGGEMTQRTKILTTFLLAIFLLIAQTSYGLEEKPLINNQKNSECFEILDILSTMEGFDYSNIEIAKRMFGNEKINFEVETWNDKCYYGIGILDGKVVIVSNKLFKRPTLLAFSDSNTVKMLFRNPSEKLFEEAIKTGKIRIEGTGFADRIKAGLTNILSRYYTFSGRKERENETINVTLIAFNLSWQNDYDGDGILNSEDVCDPYLLKENLGADPFEDTLPLVRYYTCPSHLSDSEEYLGNAPYLDIYDYVMNNGCGVKDTDSGKRYYTRGSICVENVSYYPPRIYGRGPYERMTEDKVISKCEQIYTDYCLDDETLVEYYYESPRRVVYNHPIFGQQVIHISGGIRNITYKCPFGCRMGACVLKDIDSPEWELPSIINGEKAYGFNPWTRGYYGCEGLEYISLKTGKSIHEITENDFFGDECVNETTLREYYLTVEKVMTLWRIEDKPVLKSEYYTCPSRCMERRCIERGDLNIVYAEPVQVVYGAPLIKGKGTAFRVGVSSSFDVRVSVKIELDLPDDQWEVLPDYPTSWTVEIPAHADNYTVMLPYVPYWHISSPSSIFSAGIIEGSTPLLPQDFSIPVSPSCPIGLFFGPYDPSYRNIPRPISDSAEFTVKIDPENSWIETDENNNEFTGDASVVATKPVSIAFFIHVWGKAQGDADIYASQNPDVKNFVYPNGTGYAVRCYVEGKKEDITVEEAVTRAMNKAPELVEYFLGVAPIADRKIEYYINPVLYTIEEFADGNFSIEDVREEAKREYLRSIRDYATSYDYVVTLNPCSKGGQNVGNTAALVGAHPDTSPAVIGHELLSHQISGFDEECYNCNPYRLPNNGNVCCETCNYSSQDNCPQGDKWCDTCDVDCETCVASEGFWVNKWKSYEAGRWERSDGEMRIVGSKYYACGYIPVDITWQRLGKLKKYNSNEELPGGYLDLIEELENPNDPVVIKVKGMVFRNGSARFRNFWVVEGYESRLSDTGDYYILLLDSHGNVLKKHGFTPVFFETTEEHELKEIDSAFFTFNIPWKETTKSIQIVDKNGNVLDERVVSKGKPRVEVISPKEGEVFEKGDTITVRWSGSDPDGDLLVYIVEMSKNNGKWSSLTGEIMDNLLKLNADQLTKGEYRFRVIASDGVNTVYAVSGSFRVNTPEVHVKKEICGDGFCDITKENAFACPQDCPTGIKDDICDAIKDNRVDPDCKEGVDPDDPAIYEEKIAERHAQANYPIYGAIATFTGIIILIFEIILRKFRKR